MFGAFTSKYLGFIPMVRWQNPIVRVLSFAVSIVPLKADGPILQFFVHDLDNDQSIPAPEITLRLKSFGQTDFSKPGYRIQIAVETTHGDNHLRWLNKKYLFGFALDYDLRFKLKEYGIYGWMAIPFLVNRHLEGNAREKFKAKIGFINEGQLSIIELEIKDQLTRTDILRINGFKLRPEDPSQEVGNSIFKFRFVSSDRSRVMTDWEILSVGEIRIGSISVLKVSPERDILDDFAATQPVLHLATSQFANLGEGQFLEVKIRSVFPKSARIKWDKNSNIFLKLDKQGSPGTTVKIETEIKDKVVRLRLKGTIGENTNFSISGLRYTMPTDLSTNVVKLVLSIIPRPDQRYSLFRANSASKPAAEQELTQYLFRPHIDFDLGTPLMIDKTRGGDISIILNQSQVYSSDPEASSDSLKLLMPGDVITFTLPSDTPLNWAKISSDEVSTYTLQSPDARSLKLKIKAPISDYLKIDGIRISKSQHSARDVIISYTFDYSPSHEFQIVNSISQGSPVIKMGSVKFVKKNQRTELKDIIISEDNLVTTITMGSTFRIGLDNPYVRFDRSRMINLTVIDEATNKRSHDFILDTRSTNKETISFRSIKNIDPGSSYRIKNIPIVVEQDFNSTSDLNYSISSNDQINFLMTDPEVIKVAKITLEADAQEFYATKRNTNNTYKIGDIKVSIEGKAGMIKKGEGLELTFDSPEIFWVHNSDASSDLHYTTISYLKAENGYAKVMRILYTQDNRTPETLVISGAAIAIRGNIRSLVGLRMKVGLAVDSTFSAMSTAMITYAKIGFSSPGDQRFFLDDDEYRIYDLLLKPRGLRQEFMKDQTITVLLPEDTGLQWSDDISRISLSTTATDEVIPSQTQISGRAAIIKIGQNLFTADQEAREGTNILISGLKIRKTDNIFKDGFSLAVSLDDGRRIAALDNAGNTKKIILPAEEYDEKIAQRLKDLIFGMRSKAQWEIRLPEQSGLVWDTSRTTITQGRMNEFNFNSIDTRVKYSEDRRSVFIVVAQGAGQITQGFALNGIDKKSLSIGGLGILMEEEFTEPQVLKLIVETPYGDREIPSEGSGNPYDWGLRFGLTTGGAGGRIQIVNSIKIEHFPQRLLEYLVLIRPPQMKNAQGGIMTNLEILVNGEHHNLLYVPLVINFNITDRRQALSTLISTFDFINLLYNSTVPKGRNWKTWYYLSWAKWNAQQSDLGESYDEHIADRMGNERLTGSTYMENLERAIELGFRPNTIHHEYDVPEPGSITQKLEKQLRDARKKMDERKYTEAEIILLNCWQSIQNQKRDNSDELLDLYGAEALLALGKISVWLQDDNYDNFWDSYAYNILDDATDLYREVEGLQRYDASMIDTIRTFQTMAARMVEDRNPEDSMFRLPVDSSPQANIFDSTFVEFNFRYNQDFTYHIIGLDGYEMRYSYGSDQFSQSRPRFRSNFGDKLQLSNGGAYRVEFSPNGEALKNLITSGLIGLVAIALYTQ